MARWLTIFPLLAGIGGCAGASAPPPTRVPPPPVVAAVATSSTSDPVSRGELPWWHSLSAGVYVWQDQRVVLAVGQSADHHHVAEGFLKAKVIARLGVRKAAEPVGFSGTMPEPELSDLFITREQKFYVLYRMPLPREAALQSAPPTLEVPPALGGSGRRRVGRHVFDGARHLYLECEVEGPIANPDWGRTRATASLRP